MTKNTRILGLAGLLALPTTALADGDEVPAYCSDAINVPVCVDGNENGICDDGEKRLKTAYRHIYGVMFPGEAYTHLFESDASKARHMAVGKAFSKPDGEVYTCTLARAEGNAELVAAIEDSDVQRYDYTQNADERWIATLVNRDPEDLDSWEGDDVFLDNTAVAWIPIGEVERRAPEIPEDPVVETPEVPAPFVPERDRRWFPRGEDTFDLGHSGVRAGVAGSNTSWKQTYMNSTEGTQVTDINEQNGSILVGATVPIVDFNTDEASDAMLFVAYDGEFTGVRGSIEGNARSHRLVGGLQLATEDYGLGVAVGPMHYNRTTTDVSGDLTLETQQVGWGKTLLASARAPRVVAGYTLESLPNMDVLVDGEIEGYEDLDISAEASANVMRHNFYAGPRFTPVGAIDLIPYGELTLTNVEITGEGSVEDTWSKEPRVDVGGIARFWLTDNLSANVQADYTLLQEWNNPEGSLETRTGHKGAEAKLGLEYSW